MTDVVQVVTRIGGSVVDIQFVDGVHDLPWASARIDGFVARLDGEAHAITAAPLRAKLGIAEVTFTREPRARPSVPRAVADLRIVAYLLGSLALHVCLTTVADAFGAGEAPGIGAPYVAGPNRVRSTAVAIDDLDLGDDPAGTLPRTSMRLAEPTTGDPESDFYYESVDFTDIPYRETDDLYSTEGSFAEIGEKAAAALGGSTDLASAVAASSAAGEHEGDRGFGHGRPQRTANELGWGTIGTGSYGTLGHGPDGYGVSGGVGGMRARQAAVPQVYLCGPRPDGSSCVVAVGGLDKAMIARYVRRHLSKVQYCYEKQLLANATLEGDIVMEFMIAASGKVTTVTAAGSPPEVAACVTDVVRAIEFPRAANGGDTQVRYPFSFRVAG